MWWRTGIALNSLPEELMGDSVRLEANRAFGTVQSGPPIGLENGCLQFACTTTGLLPDCRMVTSEDQTYLRDRFLFDTICHAIGRFPAWLLSNVPLANHTRRGLPD